MNEKPAPRPPVNATLTGRFWCLVFSAIGGYIAWNIFHTLWTEEPITDGFTAIFALPFMLIFLCIGAGVTAASAYGLWKALGPVTEPIIPDEIELRVPPNPVRQQLDHNLKNLSDEFDALRALHNEIAVLMGTKTSISVQIEYVKHWKKHYDNCATVANTAGAEAPMSQMDDHDIASRIKNLNEAIASLRKYKEDAVAEQNFELASALRDAADKSRDELSNLSAEQRRRKIKMDDDGITFLPDNKAE